jgi:hypothetical protein
LRSGFNRTNDLFVIGLVFTVLDKMSYAVKRMSSSAVQNLDKISLMNIFLAELSREYPAREIIIAPDQAGGTRTEPC